MHNTYVSSCDVSDVICVNDIYGESEQKKTNEFSIVNFNEIYGKKKNDATTQHVTQNKLVIRCDFFPERRQWMREQLQREFSANWRIKKSKKNELLN